MKRFTETTKWSDPWFYKLPSRHKLFWLFILDNCNCAGVWNVNIDLASSFVGEALDQAELLKVFKDRIEDLGDGYWWVVKFVAFQHKTISEHNPHGRAVIDKLREHSLYERAIGAKTRRTNPGPRQPLPSPCPAP